MAEALQDLGDHIAAKLGAAITGATYAYDELTLEAEAAEIVRVLTFLRDDPDCGFVCFIDICGADYPDRERRFDVVYHLLSPYKNRRIRVKIRTDEETPACFLPITRISAASSPTTVSPDTRCARTSR
jgi:NADH-quinone oxidoreductase subunit C